LLKGETRLPFGKGGKGGFLSVSKSVTKIKMENEPSPKR